MPNFQPSANSAKQLVVFLLTSSLLFMLLAFSANSQSLSLQLTPSQYGEEYNISCFGLSDGSVDLTVTGGTPPYTY